MCCRFSIVLHRRQYRLDCSRLSILAERHWADWLRHNFYDYAVMQISTGILAGTLGPRRVVT